MHTAPVKRDRLDRWLPWVLALVVVAMFAAFIFRSYSVDTKADQLCRAIATVIGEGDAALDSIDYYRQPEHADELAAAHARNERLLSLLDCRPLTH